MLLAEEKVATATAAGAEKVAEHVEESISFVNHVQSLLLEYLPSIILAIIVLIIGRYIALFARRVSVLHYFVRSRAVSFVLSRVSDK